MHCIAGKVGLNQKFLLLIVEQTCTLHSPPCAHAGTTAIVQRDKGAISFVIILIIALLIMLNSPTQFCQCTLFLDTFA